VPVRRLRPDRLVLPELHEPNRDLDPVETERAHRAGCELGARGDRNPDLAVLDLDRHVLIPEGVADASGLPDELESWAEVAQQLRTHWKADGVAIARRRPLLLRALNELYREAA